MSSNTKLYLSIVIFILVTFLATYSVYIQEATIIDKIGAWSGLLSTIFTAYAFYFIIQEYLKFKVERVSSEIIEIRELFEKQFEDKNQFFIIAIYHFHIRLLDNELIPNDKLDKQDLVKCLEESEVVSRQLFTTRQRIDSLSVTIYTKSITIHDRLKEELEELDQVLSLWLAVTEYNQQRLNRFMNHSNISIFETAEENLSLHYPKDLFNEIKDSLDGNYNSTKFFECSRTLTKRFDLSLMKFTQKAKLIYS